MTPKMVEVEMICLKSISLNVTKLTMLVSMTFMVGFVGMIIQQQLLGLLESIKRKVLHPEQDRNISAREASLLQSFPIGYKFPLDIPKHNLALMIGNALPPKFSYYQSMNIRQHIEHHLKNKTNSTVGKLSPYPYFFAIKVVAINI